MRRLLLTVLTVLASAAACAAQALTVLTYNIRYDNPDDGPDRWTNRRDEVVRLILDHDPAVVGLQEALRNQLDDLARALTAYDEIGVGRDDGKAKGEYAAILYRKDLLEPLASGTFWFSDTPGVAGSRSWGNQVVRICTWARLRERSSGRGFYVYNVHLDHESQPSREKSAALLGQRLLARDHREEPAVVTGDFNAGEQNPALAAVKAPVLVEYLQPDGVRERPIRLADTFRVVHPGQRDAGTFNNFGRPGGGAEKIDYILVELGVKTVDAGMDRRSKDGRFPSDHFAVWAKLEVPAAPGGSTVRPAKAQGR